MQVMKLLFYFIGACLTLGMITVVDLLWDQTKPARKAAIKRFGQIITRNNG